MFKGKNVVRLASWFFALSLGLFLGKQLFRPCTPIDALKSAPHLYSDRTVHVQGMVSNPVSVSGVWKSYDLCDTITGSCITVKTRRSILPPEHLHLRIRATVSEPAVLLGKRHLMLTEV